MIDNRPILEDVLERSEIDSGIEGSGAQPITEPNASPTCAKEDALYSSTPVRIADGFARSDLFLCPNTSDIFEVSGRPGAQLNVRLTANPADRDLNLSAADLDGNVVTASAGSNGAESIQLQFTQARQTLRIAVTATDNIASRYFLTVNSGCIADRDCPQNTQCLAASGSCRPIPSANCGLDYYEPNDREDSARALEQLPIMIEGNICEQDVDWYEFSVRRGTIIDVLATSENGVNVDLEVLRATDGNQIAQAQGGGVPIGGNGINRETLSLANLPGGGYLLGVRRILAGDETDGDVSYQLEVAGRSGGCTNAEQCTTSSLPICLEGVCVEAAVGAPLGVVCGRSSDCAPGADVCYIGSAGGQDNLCTLECEDDSTCAGLGDGAYCQPVNDTTSVCLPRCEDQNHCSDFSVCTNGACVPAPDCRTDVDCDPTRVCRSNLGGDRRNCASPKVESPCGSDLELEPNDRFANATSLPLNELVRDLRICDSDEDYFFFELPFAGAPFVLTIEASFRTGVDIDIYTYDTVGNRLGQGATYGETTETVRIPSLAIDRVYVRVVQFQSNRLADTSYTLSATLESDPQRCTDGSVDCYEISRTRCDQRTGACGFIEGQGRVPLGDYCDSNDDCDESADLCPPLYGAYCTVYCETDSDCRDVGSTSCEFLGQGLRICL